MQWIVQFWGATQHSPQRQKSMFNEKKIPTDWSQIGAGWSLSGEKFIEIVILAQYIHWINISNMQPTVKSFKQNPLGATFFWLSNQAFCNARSVIFTKKTIFAILWIKKTIFLEFVNQEYYCFCHSLVHLKYFKNNFWHANPLI